MRLDHRRWISLFLFAAMTVIVVTGVLAFFRPFSLRVMSLHVVFGMLMAPVVVWHVCNNRHKLTGYLRGKALGGRTSGSAIAVSLIVSLVAAAAWLQLPSITALMGLSYRADETNREPPVLRKSGELLNFEYQPGTDYDLNVQIKTTPEFERVLQSGLTVAQSAPHMAIWLENADGYHIHTLYVSDSVAGESWIDANGQTHPRGSILPYWNHKRTNYEKAKQIADQKIRDDVDGVSSATLNRSFIASEYVLPDSQTYSVLLEVNKPYDENDSFQKPALGQPSIVYSVRIRNEEPHHYQVMEMIGHTDTSATTIERDGQMYEEMNLQYDRSQLTTSQRLIDSVLVKITRRSKNEEPEND